VRGEDERHRRDRLQVVPRLPPEHAAGGARHVAAAVLQQVAEELLQVALHFRGLALVGQLPFEDKLRSKNKII
jgi:hypothetical protein